MLQLVEFIQVLCISADSITSSLQSLYLHPLAVLCSILFMLYNTVELNICHIVSSQSFRSYVKPFSVGGAQKGHWNYAIHLRFRHPR